MSWQVVIHLGCTALLMGCTLFSNSEVHSCFGPGHGCAALTIKESAVVFPASAPHIPQDGAVRMVNIGAHPIAGLQSSTFTLPVGLSFKGGSYPGTGGTCGTEIEPGSECTLAFQFVSDRPGVFNDPILVEFWHADGVYRRDRFATVDAPVVAPGGSLMLGFNTTGTVRTVVRP